MWHLPYIWRFSPCEFIAQCSDWSNISHDSPNIGRPRDRHAQCACWWFDKFSLNSSAYSWKITWFECVGTTRSDRPKMHRTTSWLYLPHFELWAKSVSVACRICWCTHPHIFVASPISTLLTCRVLGAKSVSVACRICWCFDKLCPNMEVV